MKTCLFSKTLTLLLVLASGAMLPAHAATRTVTTTADSGPGSLRQAVLDANAAPAEADTIVFDPAVFGSPQTITLASEIDISPVTGTTDSLTIVGPGANLLTISGNGTVRIFDLGPGDTNSISGMTLTKGAGSDGGAIQNESNLTLTDIVFLENVTNSGGAIYTSNGTVNVNRCTFTNNQTTGTNINGDGGSAMEIRGGTVNITGCVMRGGTTRGGGGAIRNNSPTTISDTLIENNTSGGSGNSDGGGAIRNTGVMTLTNCIVRGNKAGENTNGGAIVNEDQLTLVNTIITNNTADGHGGGIYEGAGTGGDGDFLRITNSTISNNVANEIRDNSGAGGGIYGETGCDITISGSTISGNQVRITAAPTSSTVSDGGGVYSDGKLTIDRSTISGNAAGVEFGGVRTATVFQDTLVTNSTIANNIGGGFGKDDCNLSCRTVALGNTIVSGNTPWDVRSGGPGGADSNDAPIASLGSNLIGTFNGGTLYTASSSDLIGVDPKFGPLQDNGGPTATHAPQAGSPVIDKGKRLSDATIDQRGVNRPFDDLNIANAPGGDGSEIGAFEIGEALVAQEQTLGNVSTRLPVLSGEQVGIVGVIVSGNSNKPLLIRGVGPSIPVDDRMQDPTLELYSGDTLLAFNDNWKDTQQAQIQQTGIAPTDDREAAIYRELPAGLYTSVLRGKNDTTGVALIEWYDLAIGPETKVVNISTRGFIGTGDGVLITGFFCGSRTRVVVRAIAPSLGNAGVQGALQDPRLDLVDSNGTVLRQNDNWKNSIQRDEINALGFGPADDREAAIIATLPAGNYTGVMTGVGGSTGVGLVEVYNLP
jgi:predicted outer membrane repeat protein